MYTVHFTAGGSDLRLCFTERAVRQSVAFKPFGMQVLMLENSFYYWGSGYNHWNWPFAKAQPQTAIIQSQLSNHNLVPQACRALDFSTYWSSLRGAVVRVILWRVESFLFLNRKQTHSFPNTHLWEGCANTRRRHVNRSWLCFPMDLQRSHFFRRSVLEM